MIPTYDPKTEYVAFINDEYIVQQQDITRVREKLISTLKRECQEMLQATDWYILRAAEGGAAVPADIITVRAAIRTKCDNIESVINAATIEELKGFSWGWGS